MSNHPICWWTPGDKSSSVTLVSARRYADLFVPTWQRERERKMEERGGTIVWRCITTALCACGQPVNHPFPFQVKTLAPSQGSSTHINCPPHHCSAASKKISYYNYGLHTQEQSLIDMYSADMGRAGVADNYCRVFVRASMRNEIIWDNLQLSPNLNPALSAHTCTQK